MDSDGSTERNVEILVITDQEITCSSTETKEFNHFRPPKIPVETLTCDQPPPVRSLNSGVPTWTPPPSPGRANKFCPSPHRSFRSSPASAAPSNTTLRRRSVARSAFQKPKTRFAEPFAKIDENAPLNTIPNSPNIQPSGGSQSVPVTPKTPLLLAEDEDEDEEIYKRVSNIRGSRMKGKVSFSIQWVAFVCFLGVLLAILSVSKLHDLMVWKLKIWKWCVMIMVIVFGQLMSKCALGVLIFFIEKNFLLRKGVLYLVYGLRKSAQLFIWLSLILLTWVLLINRGVRRSEHTARILNYVTRALACLLVGSTVWMVKIFLLKLLASSFSVKRFFDRIQESIFHQYILQTLSGPPHMELAETIGAKGDSYFQTTNKKVLNVAALSNIKKEKVSGWTMKGLINVVTNSGLSLFSNEIESIGDDGAEQNETEITNEGEAKAAAMRIFKNVAKFGQKYIDEDDLLRFLSKSEANVVLPLFVGAAETGQIKKSAMRDWVVMVYHERKSLAHSLNDTKALMNQFNSLISTIVIVAIFISWLLIMGFAAVQVFVSISSLLLVVAFMLGNTAKTTFESILFVFVRHPFDVGDRCVIEGIQMVVEEIKLLKTVFLRHDNEKIDYPNFLLATKPISNFNRSPDMGDTLDFCIDVSTPIESIEALKAKIKTYIESHPTHWNYRHLIEVKGIEDLNKMKMTLYVNHTMNYQNFWVRCSRRSELVIEMKKIFEELSIKYHLLPQEVHVNHVGQQLHH